MVASDPPLEQQAAALSNGKARAGGDAARAVHLALDLADLDAEAVLLQAASANAAVQLGGRPFGPGPDAVGTAVCLSSSTSSSITQQAGG